MTAPTSLSADVFGKPVPQGSHHGFVNNKTGRVVVMPNNRSKLLSWREIVANACRDAMPYDWQRLEDAVAVSLVFYVERPRGHYGTGRNAAVLKPSAPMFPTTKPDLDKLVRSTLDAFSNAGVYRDDSQVVRLVVDEWFADTRIPGAYILVAPRTAPAPVETEGGTVNTGAGASPDDVPLFD